MIISSSLDLPCACHLGALLIALLNCGESKASETSRLVAGWSLQPQAPQRKAPINWNHEKRFKKLRVSMGHSCSRDDKEEVRWTPRLHPCGKLAPAFQGPEAPATAPDNVTCEAGELQASPRPSHGRRFGRLLPPRPRPFTAAIPMGGGRWRCHGRP